METNPKQTLLAQGKTDGKNCLESVDLAFKSAITPSVHHSKDLEVLQHPVYNPQVAKAFAKDVFINKERKLKIRR